MTFHSYQNGHYIPMGMKWAHFIPIGMIKAFHSGPNGLFIPTGMEWIDFNFIGMNWVHFSPNGMDLAFHSSWNDQFIPIGIKWIHSIPSRSVRQQRMARSTSMGFWKLWLDNPCPRLAAVFYLNSSAPACFNFLLLPSTDKRAAFTVKLWEFQYNE